MKWTKAIQRELFDSFFHYKYYQSNVNKCNLGASLSNIVVTITCIEPDTENIFIKIFSMAGGRDKPSVLHRIKLTFSSFTFHHYCLSVTSFLNFVMGSYAICHLRLHRWGYTLLGISGAQTYLLLTASRGTPKQRGWLVFSLLLFKISG